MSFFDFILGKIELSIVTEEGTTTTIISKKQLLKDLKEELAMIIDKDRESMAQRRSLEQTIAILSNM